MHMKKRLLLCLIVFICIFTFGPQLYRGFLSTVNNDIYPPEKLLPKPKLQDLVTHIVYLGIKQLTDNAYVQKSLNLWPKKIILTDHYIRPKFLNASIKIIHLNFDIFDSEPAKNPLLHVNTPYIILTSRIPKNFSHENIQLAITAAKKYRNDILIIPYQNQLLQCYSLSMKLKEWTLKYKKVDGEICGAVSGNHAIFGSTKLLKTLAKPWMEPFPEPLYIQAAASGINLRILYDMAVPAERWEKMNDPSEERAMRYNMYDQLKVKKVVWDNRVEWYGCTRNTTRCFGTVNHDTPDYLLSGRWTPPCCLRVLRETARHVFRVLGGLDVRYWLEGGSLLGAMRSNDVIPWDYDVDVGVYQSDLLKCPWIRELHQQIDRGIESPRVIDKKGYVWEMSQPSEGQFYRVQSSTINRLHVDIFGFYSRNGIMTKDYWMSHRQDREFPESYLKPLTKIPFVGMKVNAPNNIRDFLEFKFGPGCIENPEYPNPSLLAFPKKFVSTTEESEN